MEESGRVVLSSAISLLCHHLPPTVKILVCSEYQDFNMVMKGLGKSFAPGRDIGFGSF